MADEKKKKKKKGDDEPKKKKGKKDQGIPEKPIPPPRLWARYREEVVPQLKSELNLKSVSQVPRLDKIVINMGLGEAIKNNKILDAAVEELGLLTGQKAVVTKAKKSISNFKLREGMPIGAMVTLRRNRMWEFLDRLVAVALPRMRDFKGVSAKAIEELPHPVPPWQPHARAQGADHLSGDRLRQGRQGSRHEHLLRNHRGERRARQGAAYCAGSAVCEAGAGSGLI